MGDSNQWFFGNSFAQSLGDLPSMRTADFRLGFTRPWSGTVTARLIRVTPTVEGGAVRTEVVASGSLTVRVSRPQAQWVRFTLPTPPAGPLPVVGTLAIELVDLPAGVGGRAVVAWIRCSSTYGPGELTATGQVALGIQGRPTPLQVSTGSDAVFRVFA